LNTESKTHLETPGKSGPAIFAFDIPKASALKFHQSNGSQLNNALLALRKHSRVLRHRRAFADCFGANPSPRLWVTAPGATPARLCEHTMRVFYQPSEPELSTWPGIGTFYLAPTRNGEMRYRRRGLHDVNGVNVSSRASTRLDCPRFSCLDDSFAVALK